MVLFRYCSRYLRVQFSVPGKPNKHRIIVAISYGRQSLTILTWKIIRVPAIVKRLTAAGLRDVDYRATSLKDAEQYEPADGVYTVSNTCQQTQTALLDAHLDRLEDSAAREDIPLRYQRSRLRSALRKMIVDSAYGDVRFRISTGAATPQELLLTIEPFQPPAPDIAGKGVACNSTSALARHDPRSKSSRWMQMRESLEAARPAEIYETLLLDGEGRILEGLSSNFYAVMDGALYTAGGGVLAGISRRVVLAVCESLLPLRLEAPECREMSRFEEAFISSSSRGIIPVVAIDGRAIADGRVGSKTIALQKAYRRWVAERLEEL